jgi:hypothetical protein
MKQVITLRYGDFLCSLDDIPNNLEKVVVRNEGVKPIYIRIGKKSITISDRKPSTYGVKKT